MHRGNEPKTLNRLREKTLNRRKWSINGSCHSCLGLIQIFLPFTESRKDPPLKRILKMVFAQEFSITPNPAKSLLYQKYDN